MGKDAKPIVSVGVPVYNGGEFLYDCLNSILNQTFEDWECIVCDNQSSDNSLEIARDFEKKDKRFKVILNEKFVPLADNWNNTFVKGNLDAKYYKLVQADDWIFPEYLEKAVKLFEKDDSIGTISSYRLAGVKVDGCGLDPNKGQVYSGNEILYKQLTRKLDISGDITNMVFSNEHLKKLSFYPRIFNGKYHVDTELFYDVLDVSNCGFIFQVLSYTRRHPDSQTNTVVFKYNTFLQYLEEVFFRFKRDNEVLNKLYRRLRVEYAYFYLKNKLLNSKSYQWHKQHIEREFTLSEYVEGVFTLNFIVKFLKWIFKKAGNLLRKIK